MELVCDKQCFCAFENTDRTLIDDNGFIPICKVVFTNKYRYQNPIEFWR